MSIFRHIAITMTLVVLFGWVMSEFYLAMVDISQFNPSAGDTTMFEINLNPLLAFVCLGGVTTFVRLRKRKKEEWSKALLLPEEFNEKDERETELTNRACRASYISLMWATPIICALLLFYPIVSETMPFYPIIIFLLLPLTQLLAYIISWYRHY
ncbi:hypothetical protein HXA34_06330 [Salipaludibacillus agaradhaerens]|uniref:hypothetical protein n=1 Tax=Salipaludibacillus agaradhaerens TaxID=76935 RepID=UPI0021515DF5|nr:hypothetical protein [Salipaludibacillus agaradhaerens]MCR6105911.1 hypothetical protein [Salipaludibacillus agaradhaerens]MCR6117944.1 hypothetical protein [Salipaludibacillus agaradhaerens]